MPNFSARPNSSSADRLRRSARISPIRRATGLSIKNGNATAFAQSTVRHFATLPSLAAPPPGVHAVRNELNGILSRDVHDDFVKSGDAGKRTAVFFPFLDSAFAIGGADDQGVIAD